MQRMRIALALTAAALLALPAALQARSTHPSKRTAKITVTAALQSLEQAGQLPAAEYARYEGIYAAAKHSLANLSGTRRSELGGVLANVEAMAAAGEFIPSRLPVVFLTLERNREWWTTKYIPASRARVTFPGSHILWEYYAGQGIEIQWLGTFGEANGYYLAGNENTQLKELLNEVIPLATQRAGGIAWEYMFQFDGGLPPWTSGLSQGTALSALSRAWSRLHEAQYLKAAQQALGIYEQPPPQGVRVAMPTGVEYAEYTYAPGDYILNGFIQALNGLYDYASITKDPLGEQLFEAGDAQARTEVPHYNTGAWSMYDQHEESDLSYHELLAEFLQHLCERTRKGEPLPSTPTSTQIAGDEIYCSTAEAFTADIHEPPVLELLTTTLQGGTRAGVQMKLSKVGTVSMRISKGGKTVWSTSATVEGGKPKLLWVTPSSGGIYEVTLSATDLAGNHESTTGTIVVSGATPSKPKKAKQAAA
jgi:hypothetical protein